MSAVRSLMEADVSPRHCCWLTVDDVRGRYTIPMIQSGRDLVVRANVQAFPGDAVRVTMTLQRRGEPVGRRQTADRSSPVAEFAGLAAGEYTLTVAAEDADGVCLRGGAYSPIGIGTVIAALGDSLTEGYHGRGFMRLDLDLHASDFPDEAVSADGRNFPQFAPTAAHHRPSVNCFESWLSRLNDGLTVAWRQPVFIANEGWGGATSGDYLAMMRRNGGGWADRMQLLCPAVWLIHLGVNDERRGVSPEAYARHMRGIVDTLSADYDASAERIYIARPSYDYAEGAETRLHQYIAAIDALAAEAGIGRGPDFFTAFSHNRELWYGADPVHPGPEGMALMADLWLEALRDAPPRGRLRAGASTLVVPPGTLLIHTPPAGEARGRLQAGDIDDRT